MTRSHKANDRDHKGLADGTAEPEQHLPRYFGKHAGHIDSDAKKTKKDGSGKANWGHPGQEVEDEDFNLTKARRRSNSSVDHAGIFKSKYERIEEEPVFEESLHGDGGVDHYELHRTDTAETSELDKSTSEESSVASVDEEAVEGKME